MHRLGRWIDFENGYKTLDPTFMESVWWVFKQLHSKGLVYQGFKVSCLRRAWSQQGYWVRLPLFCDSSCH